MDRFGNPNLSGCSSGQAVAQGTIGAQEVDADTVVVVNQNNIGGSGNGGGQTMTVSF